jgi:hypothetical protein
MTVISFPLEIFRRINAQITAPVWAKDLMANRRSRTLERRLQRTTAIRTARGYWTISYESATVLAASAPFELWALELRRVCEYLRAPPSTTTTPPDGLSASNVREEAELEIWKRWRSQLAGEDARQPHRAFRAVLPNREA